MTTDTAAITRDAARKLRDEAEQRRSEHLRKCPCGANGHPPSPAKLRRWEVKSAELYRAYLQADAEYRATEGSNGKH